MQSARTPWLHYVLALAVAPLSVLPFALVWTFFFGSRDVFLSRDWERIQTLAVELSKVELMILYPIVIIYGAISLWVLRRLRWLHLRGLLVAMFMPALLIYWFGTWEHPFIRSSLLFGAYVLLHAIVIAITLWMIAVWSVRDRG
jgi:hypothetical protein